MPCPGVSDGETGVGYGTVEYWIRLRVPMEQALRLYKVRTQPHYFNPFPVEAVLRLMGLDRFVFIALC
jgi:hypothetical protein